jgi:hypothetical protein
MVSNGWNRRGRFFQGLPALSDKRVDGVDFLAAKDRIDRKRWSVTFRLRGSAQRRSGATTAGTLSCPPKEETRSEIAFHPKEVWKG